MISLQEFTEKRREKRYKPNDMAFFVLRSDPNTLGLIKNISKNGLAFQYFTAKNITNGLHRGDIFVGGGAFYLKNVRFQSIFDFYVEPEYSFSLYPKKRCGGRFIELSPEQISSVDHFIKTFTVHGS